MESKGFVPHEPVDAEVFFTEFALRNGGRLVSEIVGHSPAFFNADFYFSEFNVVAELKCLKTDFPKSKIYEKKISDLFEKWSTKPEFKFGLIWGKEPYPREFVLEFIKLFKRPIKQVLEKANKQIKNTKKELRLNSAKGLAIVINDGFYSLEPRYTYALISDVLSYLYTSIDGFVYLTLNKHVEYPNDEYARLVWFTGYGNAVDDELVEFVNNLGRKWWHFLEERRGKFDSHIETKEGADYINEARFINFPSRILGGGDRNRTDE